MPETGRLVRRIAGAGDDMGHSRFTDWGLNYIFIGGYFISFQDGMAHEHTKPETMLGHLADQLKIGVDFSLDRGFVADAMIRCGFRSVRSCTIDTPMGAMDMDIAHKQDDQ
jgi:hypothetical protein